MDITKRMVGAVILTLLAALLLAYMLKSKGVEKYVCMKDNNIIIKSLSKPVEVDRNKFVIFENETIMYITADYCIDMIWKKKIDY